MQCVCAWANCRNIQAIVFRSTRLVVFFKIGVLENFAIFPGEYLCWSLCLIKLQAFRSVIREIWMGNSKKLICTDQCQEKVPPVKKA